MPIENLFPPEYQELVYYVSRTILLGIAAYEVPKIYRIIRAEINGNGMIKPVLEDTISFLIDRSAQASAHTVPRNDLEQVYSAALRHDLERKYSAVKSTLSIPHVTSK